MAPLDDCVGYGVLVHRLRDRRQCGRAVGYVAPIAAVARDNRYHDHCGSRPSPAWLDYNKPGKHASSASPVGKESLAACRTCGGGRFLLETDSAKEVAS